MARFNRLRARALPSCCSDRIKACKPAGKRDAMGSVTAVGIIRCVVTVDDPARWNSVPQPRAPTPPWQCRVFVAGWLLAAGECVTMTFGHMLHTNARRRSISDTCSAAVTVGARLISTILHRLGRAAPAPATRTAPELPSTAQLLQNMHHITYS